MMTSNVYRTQGVGSRKIKVILAKTTVELSSLIRGAKRLVSMKRETNYVPDKLITRHLNRSNGALRFTVWVLTLGDIPNEWEIPSKAS